MDEPNDLKQTYLEPPPRKTWFQREDELDFVCRVCRTKVYGHASRTRPSKLLISRELFIAFARHRLCVVCATKAMMTDAMQQGVSVALDDALEAGEVQPK